MPRLCTPRQLAFLEALFEVEPFEPERADFRAAQGDAMFFNVHRAKDQPAKTAYELMPFAPRQPKQRKSRADILALYRALGSKRGQSGGQPINQPQG